MTSSLITAWNGINLLCPKQWETIVVGPKHLLFEEDFQPIFEVRWQENNIKGKNSIDSILHTLQKDAGLSKQGSPTAAFLQLNDRYELIALTTEQGQKGVLLICRHCGTALLFYFLHENAMHHSELPQVLFSLNCHALESSFTLWAIQDFRVHIPAGYELNTHHFGAGLTKISFTHAGLTMHLCRLAQASRRLETTSQSQLMLLLSGIPVPEEEIVHAPLSTSHRNHPGILRQILTRFKRRPSFHWMILRHHPEQDRLTGLFFEDNKPITEEQVNAILNSYEILPH